MDKIIKAQKDFPVDRKFPTRELHFERNDYNLIPTGDLVRQKGKVTYIDEDGNVWNRMPWYFTLFHKPFKYAKFLHFDSNIVGTAIGSSEIKVDRKSINKRSDGSKTIHHSDILPGSYNFRDLYLSSRWQHWVADVLPTIVHCKCKCISE
jgi:hypothetical protein